MFNKCVLFFFKTGVGVYIFSNTAQNWLTYITPTVLLNQITPSTILNYTHPDLFYRYLYGFEEYCTSTNIFFHMDLPTKVASSNEDTVMESKVPLKQEAESVENLKEEPGEKNDVCNNTDKVPSEEKEIVSHVIIICFIPLITWKCIKYSIIEGREMDKGGYIFVIFVPWTVSQKVRDVRSMPIDKLCGKYRLFRPLPVW